MGRMDVGEGSRLAGKLSGILSRLGTEAREQYPRLIDRLDASPRAQRLLGGETTAHLGHETRALEGRHRDNGRKSKRLKTETGKMELAIRRDREGNFEPVLVAKGQGWLPGPDQRVIALHARGTGEGRRGRSRVIRRRSTRRRFCRPWLSRSGKVVRSAERESVVGAARSGSQPLGVATDFLGHRGR